MGTGRTVLAVVGTVVLTAALGGGLWSMLAIRAEVERTWQLSASAPLPDPPRPWTDDPAVWAAWGSTLRALPEGCPEAVDRRFEGDASAPLADDCAAALLAVAQTLPAEGLFVPTPPLDAPPEAAPHLMAVRPAHRWLLLLAGEAAARGDWTAAGAVIAQDLQMGRTVAHGGNLVAAMVGAMVDEGVAEWIEQREPEPAFWDLVGPEAAAGRDWPHPMLAALTAECRSSEDLFRSLLENPKVRQDLPPGVVGTPLYSEDKTIARLRADCRSLLAEVPKAPADRSFPDPEDLSAPKPLAWVDNPIGRILLSIATPDWGAMVARSDEARAARARLSDLAVWGGAPVVDPSLLDGAEAPRDAATPPPPAPAP